MTPDQCQNLIDDWSSPKPIDAFYKRIFGMTFAEKKHKKKWNILLMKMARKKKLENLKKKHYQYIKSLGVNIDIDSGKIESGFEGYLLMIYLVGK